MNSLQRYLHDFFQLIYPGICYACGKTLYHQEEIMCTSCLADLPKTDFQDFRNNKVSKLFWGRVQIEYATSFFHFFSGSKYQNLIHQLKYKNRQEIGPYLGKAFGQVLKNTPISQVDYICPVPLHKKKLRKRTYNQSALIADGLGQALKLPVITDNIERLKTTGTQTKRSRYDRWLNVEGIFSVKNKEKFIEKHILLVDDVVTTGSTLESCANEIVKIKDSKVSIVTLAFAS